MVTQHRTCIFNQKPLMWEKNKLPWTCPCAMVIQVWINGLLLPVKHCQSWVPPGGNVTNHALFRQVGFTLNLSQMCTGCVALYGYRLFCPASEDLVTLGTCIRNAVPPHFANHRTCVNFSWWRADRRLVPLSHTTIPGSSCYDINHLWTYLCRAQIISAPVWLLYPTQTSWSTTWHVLSWLIE